MPQRIRAVVVDPAAPGKLALQPVELRDPDRDEVAVRVSAISLNRGETRRALQVAEPGWRGGAVTTGGDPLAAKPHGPFWLILDSLGGPALSAALSMLQPGGTCVAFGASDATTTSFESRGFFGTGGARLYGLTLFHEL